MPNSVFITGPAGCGKTKNAAAFAKKLGLEVHSDWEMGQNFHERGMLYLTNESKEEVENAVLGDGADLTVIEYDKAVKLYL